MACGVEVLGAEVELLGACEVVTGFGLGLGFGFAAAAGPGRRGGGPPAGESSTNTGLGTSRGAPVSPSGLTSVEATSLTGTVCGA
jgi:hypothetical protein